MNLQISVKFSGPLADQTSSGGNLMSKVRYSNLILAISFLASGAMAASFADLNPTYLSKYFDQNVRSNGLACSLPNEKVLAVFQSSLVPQNQADCFVLDYTDKQNIFYVLKPSCSPEALNAKLKSASANICNQIVAESSAEARSAAISRASSSSSGGKAAAPGGAGSGLQVTDIAQAGIAAAVAADQYKKSTAAEKKAAGAEQSSAATPAASSSAANGDKKVISEISNVGGFSTGGASVGGAVNTAINSANGKIRELNGAPLKAGDEINLGDGQKMSLNKDGNIVNADGDVVKYDDLKMHDLCTGECQASLKRLPPETKAAGSDIASGDPKLVAPDAVATDAISQAGTASAASGQQVSAPTKPVAATDCAPVSSVVEGLAKEYQAQMLSCSSDAAMADNLCQVTRSPKAILVQQMMTIATPLISKMSSASQTCGSTADLSKIAQMGMAAAGLACSGMKMKCESSCELADVTLKKIKAESAKLKMCGVRLNAQGTAEITSSYGTNPKGYKDQADGGTTQAASGTLDGSVTAEEAKVKTVTLQCNKYSADIAQMMTQAVGLMMASQQAKDCENKLKAGGDGLTGDGGPGGSGSGSVTPSTVTMDQMCKEPSNATLSVCKCKTDPTGAGCPGAIAKLGGAPIVIKGSGTGAQLAGIGAYKQSGLSTAAQAALGLDGKSNSSGASDLQNNSANGGFGAAAGSGSSGAGSASSKTAGQDDKSASSDSAKGKFNFGSFGSLGGAIGGFFGGSKSKSGNDKLSNDKKIAEAKRQIASDQVKSEISSASGRSNWDKVSNRYVESNSTFLGQ